MGVEQAPQNDWSKEIAEGEGQDVPPDVASADRVKLRQYESIGEKDRVVEERLSRHQRQPDKGSHAMAPEERVEHFRKRSMVARA